jgi:hypothetical protein
VVLFEFFGEPVEHCNTIRFEVLDEQP